MQVGCLLLDLLRPPRGLWGGDWRELLRCSDSGQSYIGSGRESEGDWKVSAGDFQGWNFWRSDWVHIQGYHTGFP